MELDADVSSMPATRARPAIRELRPDPSPEVASDRPGPDLAVVLSELARALEETRLDACAMAVVSILAFRLGFERVSLATVRCATVRLLAVSDAPDLAPRSAFARALEVAMSEAAQTGHAVLDDDAARSGGHRLLAAKGGARAVYSFPLRHGDRVCAVLVCERLTEAATPPPTLVACEALGTMLGPALELKRVEQAARWRRRFQGRGRLAVLLGVLAIAVAVGGSEIDYRVSGPARVEGRLQRVVVAPFDGYVDTASVRAGDRVHKGQVLATLQESALKLERDTVAAEHEELAKEYRRALSVRDWAEGRVLEARMAQAKARINLLDARIERTHISAPFPGVVLSGDLSRSLGAPVERGQVLFELAPLDGHRVVLQAAERDVGEIAAGMQGTLALAALPDAEFELTVLRVSGAARTESGEPVFLVEAQLEGGAPTLRPGMEGVAKIAVEPRALVWVVSHRLVEWLQLTAWTLLP